MPGALTGATIVKSPIGETSSVSAAKAGIAVKAKVAVIVASAPNAIAYRTTHNVTLTHALSFTSERKPFFVCYGAASKHMAVIGVR